MPAMWYLMGPAKRWPVMEHNPDQPDDEVEKGLLEVAGHPGARAAEARSLERHATSARLAASRFPRHTRRAHAGADAPPASPPAARPRHLQRTHRDQHHPRLGCHPAAGDAHGPAPGRGVSRVRHRPGRTPTAQAEPRRPAPRPGTGQADPVPRAISTWWRRGGRTGRWIRSPSPSATAGSMAGARWTSRTRSADLVGQSDPAQARKATSPARHHRRAHRRRGGRRRQRRGLADQHRPELVRAAYVINTDAGGGQIKKGRRLRNPVQTSEKIYATYTLEVTNPGGHSSLPPPDNAIYALAAGLDRLSRFDFPVQLNATTRAFFAGWPAGERAASPPICSPSAADKPDPRPRHGWAAVRCTTRPCATPASRRCSRPATRRTPCPSGPGRRSSAGCFPASRRRRSAGRWPGGRATR